jgi:hypothetical protein
MFYLREQSDLIKLSYIDVSERAWNLEEAAAF